MACINLPKKNGKLGKGNKKLAAVKKAKKQNWRQKKPAKYRQRTGAKITTNLDRP